MNLNKWKEGMKKLTAQQMLRGKIVGAWTTIVGMVAVAFVFLLTINWTDKWSIIRGLGLTVMMLGLGFVQYIAILQDKKKILDLDFEMEGGDD